MKYFASLLLLLLLPLSIHAYEVMDFAEIDGIWYEICYDSETYSGEAHALFANPESEYWQSPNPFVDIRAEVNGYPVTKVIGMSGIPQLAEPTYVFIPNTVREIGDGAFRHCNSIKSVSISGYYSDYEPTAIIIGNSAFEGCENLEGVSISFPVAEIGECAFKDCTKLTGVNFAYDDNTVTTLSRGCFYGCSSLSSAPIPRSVTTIDDAAFLYCTGMTYASIPDQVTTIGKFAFGQCEKLKSLYLKDNLTTIEDGAFVFCGELPSVTLPNSVTTLGNMAFAGCRKLTTARLSTSLTSIPSRAFAGCYALTGINIPNSVRYIGERAFEGCDFMGAASYDIYDPHLGIMEEGVYQDNGSMTNVTIGASVDTIDIYAFVGHPLQSVTVMAPVPPVLKVGTAVSNTTVFDTNNFGTTILYVPQVMVNRYRTAHEWELFAHIEGIQVKGNGDSNGNGQVDISDVSTLIDELLESGSTATFNAINADINGDGEITIADVSALIDKLLEAQ
jgi:hypothetical protein